MESGLLPQPLRIVKLWWFVITTPVNLKPSSAIAVLLYGVTILLLVLLASLFTPTVRAAETINVAAAADLQFALTELAARYEKATGEKVALSFGASGNFYAQIQNGAPYDLFFSADSDYPQKLVNAGRADKSSLEIYGVGRLVLWTPDSTGFDPQQLKMSLLLEPSVRHIAIANPEHAPYGRAAIAAIEHFNLKDRVAPKLVLGESISQAAQFAQSGSAEAGLIAMSLALSPGMKNAGKYWEIPTGAYPAIRQAGVVLAASKHQTAAHAFLDYVRSAEAADILERDGFRIPAAAQK